VKRLITYEELLPREVTALALFTDGRNFKFKPDGVSSSGRWKLSLRRQFAKILVYKKTDDGGDIYLGDHLDTVAKPGDELYSVRFKNATLAGVTKENWTTFTCQPKGRSKQIYLPRTNVTWSDPLEQQARRQKDHLEGALIPVLVNRFERDSKAREECINHYGCKCQVCGFDFGSTYGADIGNDFIHVHHLVQLSKIKKAYIVKPRKDLIPVCPNCHAMLHKGNLSPKELRARLKD